MIGEIFMDFDSLARLLHFTESEYRNFSVEWPASEKVYPEEIGFLDHSFIRTHFQALRYPTDLTDALCRTAGEILKSTPLTHFAWHLYHRTFLNPNGPIWMPRYLLPDECLGKEGAGLFNLLIALASVPLIDRAYEKLGIPKRYSAEHHTWLGGTIDIFRGAHEGRFGHTLQQTAWLRLAVNGTLFRVGRFEFLLQDYPQWAPAVYVHRSTGKMVALARSQWKYDAEWTRLPDHAGNALHTARIEEGDDFIQGIQLLYDGRVKSDSFCRLDKKEWTPMISPWSLFATLHIPPGGGMSPEIARESLIAGFEFFRTYFHREIPLFCCQSWILNPEWRRLLPDSNLAKFQRSVFMVEHPVTENKDGLFFLFGRDDGDPLKEYPADNSARRAMLQVLRDGHKLKSGVMILPTSQLDLFGHPDQF